MRNFQVVLFCLIIGCMVQLIEPQESANLEKDAVQEEIPPVPKLSILENSDFDLENGDVQSRDKRNLETTQFETRVRREESEKDSECGIKTASPRFPTWPWMAALKLKQISPSDAIDCGGTIINKRFVMTSAACATNTRGIANNPDNISVVLGLADRSGSDHSQQFDVRTVHVHPQYNYRTHDHSIALLELEKPIVYNQYISPVCLPTINSNFSKPESRGLGLGWGSINQWQSDSTQKQNILKEVEVVFQHPDACIKNLGPRHASIFNDRLICGLEESPYLCTGDSGGPVMQSETQDIYHVWTQVGIINFGIGCGPVNPIGFYARVDKDLPWIQSIAF